MRPKTKAQMEILGLAIVVVIMLAAAMIYLRLSATNKDTDYRKPFTSSEIASNILNTFLDTTSRDCSQQTMTELLQDCAQSTAFVCENGKGSCDYAEETAKEIFSKTLDRWKIKYEFMACTSFDFKIARCEPNSVLIGAGSRCIGEKEFKLFPIPVSSGTMYAKLDLCG